MHAIPEAKLNVNNGDLVEDYFVSGLLITAEILVSGALTTRRKLTQRKILKNF